MSPKMNDVAVVGLEWFCLYCLVNLFLESFGKRFKLLGTSTTELETGGFSEELLQVIGVCNNKKCSMMSFQT
jgi:hypothetical protein